MGSFSWHLSAHITLWFVASHGIRTAENLRKFCGIEDPDELEVKTIHLLLIQTADGAHSGRPKNSSWQSSRVLLVAGASLNSRASTPSSKMYVVLSFAEPAERGCSCSHSHSWRLGVRCPIQSGLYALPLHESMRPRLLVLRVSLSQTSSSPPKMSNRESPREYFRRLD